MNVQRIAIIGCPGSGKTTFSEKLGALLQREPVHLDKLLWEPNWQIMPYEKRKVIHDGIIGQDEWIIDGMWRSHVEDRVFRATLIIFLDYKSVVCRFRAKKRYWKNRGKQRPDIADGCIESKDTEKEFADYVKNFRRETRPFLLDLLQKQQNAETVVFTSPKQAKKFLKNLKSN